MTYNRRSPSRCFYIVSTSYEETKRMDDVRGHFV